MIKHRTLSHLSVLPRVLNTLARRHELAHATTDPLAAKVSVLTGVRATVLTCKDRREFHWCRDTRRTRRDRFATHGGMT